jgi:hypothetical protein
MLVRAMANQKLRNIFMNKVRMELVPPYPDNQDTCVNEVA